MDVKTYQKIWGKVRNHTTKRGYFPSPEPVGFNYNSSKVVVETEYSNTEYSNYELKKQFEEILRESNAILAQG